MTFWLRKVWQKISTVVGSFNLCCKITLFLAWTLAPAFTSSLTDWQKPCQDTSWRAVLPSWQDKRQKATFTTAWLTCFTLCQHKRSVRETSIYEDFLCYSRFREHIKNYSDTLMRFHQYNRVKSHQTPTVLLSLCLRFRHCQKVSQKDYQKREGTCLLSINSISKQKQVRKLEGISRKTSYNFVSQKIRKGPISNKSKVFGLVTRETCLMNSFQFANINL